MYNVILFLFWNDISIYSNCRMQEKFAAMISDAGFQKVEYENLVGGVVAIHSGLKI